MSPLPPFLSSAFQTVAHSALFSCQREEGGMEPFSCSPLELHPPRAATSLPSGSYTSSPRVMATH